MLRFVLMLLVCLGSLASSGSLSAQRAATTNEAARAARGVTQFVCPMHPTETSPLPGTCRICKMALQDAATLGQPPYDVEVSTTPARVTPGEPFTLRLVVREPGSGAVTARFDLVHEMWYHLFIVSDDMSVFQHLHPELQADMSWTAETTLPADGRYSLLSDFAPTGTTPQFVRSTFDTSGASPDRIPRTPLMVNTSPQAAGGITATLATSPARIASGQLARMSYHLTDTVTGALVEDLQPYLGAFGHTLVVREGVTAWIHSHPTEDGPQVLSPRSRGGPEVSFDAWFTEPGRYRAWTQFKRNGDIQTVSFTFAVGPTGG